MPFGIYFHIPFCRKKCNYCGFYSITDLNLENNFIDALLNEIEKKKEILKQLYYKYNEITAFIGGGTPSLMSSKNLIRFTNKIKEYKNRIIEFTIEVNPESLTEDKLKIYRDIGINRISIGIQSFDDKVLEFLGRPHRLKDAIKTLTIANKYFDNISIDLIGGIPYFKQTKETSEKFIKEFKPKHISFYTLSKDKKNKWFDNIIIDDSKQVDDFNIFSQFLKSLGYIHYEISNFSLKGYECKHNINYWDRGEYVSFGPSAVSFLKKFYNDKDLRIKNVSNVIKYIENPLQVKKEIIPKDKALEETIMLSFRMKKGLRKKTLNSLCDEETYNKILTRINFLLQKKFLRENKKYWYIPEKHFIIINEILLWILREI